MSHIESNFSDIGVDAIKGSEIMSMLNLSIDDLSFPQNIQKLKSIVRFSNQFENYQYVINKITRGKNVDKLDHVYQYVELYNKRDAYLNEYQDVSKKIGIIDNIADEQEKNGMYTRYSDLKSKISMLEDELYLFEK